MLQLTNSALLKHPMFSETILLANAATVDKPKSNENLNVWFHGGHSTNLNSQHSQAIIRKKH